MGNKVSITQKDITEIFTESVINVTQKDSVLTEQDISVQIDNEELVKKMIEARTECIKENVHTVDECIRSYPISDISIHDITVEGVINIKTMSSSTSSITQQQQTDITDKIASKIKKETDIDVGSDTRENISNTVKNHSSVITNVLQDTEFRTKLSDKVIIKGGNISGVTVKSISDSIYNSIKGQTVFSEAMENLTKDISTDIDQKSSLFGGANKTITLIIIFVVVFFICIFVVLTLMKNKRKNIEIKKI